MRSLRDMGHRYQQGPAVSIVRTDTCSAPDCITQPSVGPTGQRANHNIAEELARRGWQESELATRRRSDPGKLASAARLRSETTLPIKWIAARVQIGTAKGAKSVLPHLAQSQDQRKTASALEPCAQLEFQSTV
jgi:hypothetical protein